MSGGVFACVGFQKTSWFAAFSAPLPSFIGVVFGRGVITGEDFGLPRLSRGAADGSSSETQTKEITESALVVWPELCSL